MVIFDGKKHAARLDEHIKERTTAAQTKGKLLIVLVGDNPASLRYIGVKMKLCAELGIDVRLDHIASELSDTEIASRVKMAFQDTNVRGGLIQLPLPRKNLNKLLDLIPPEKDVDLISSNNMTRYYSGDFSRLTPVVRAFNYFRLTTVYGEQYPTNSYVSLDESKALVRTGLAGTSVYIIGNGILVGKPIARFLKSLDVTLSTGQKYHSGDKIYSDFAVLGVGSPNLVRGEDISKNCNIIDFGTSVIDGKVVGDLDKTSTLDHLGTVALSPGGIGPVVVRFLILNFLDLASI